MRRNACVYAAAGHGLRRPREATELLGPSSGMSRSGVRSGATRHAGDAGSHGALGGGDSAKVPPLAVALGLDRVELVDELVVDCKHKELL